MLVSLFDLLHNGRILCHAVSLAVQLGLRPWEAKGSDARRDSVSDHDRPHTLGCSHGLFRVSHSTTPTHHPISRSKNAAPGSPRPLLALANHHGPTFGEIAPPGTKVCQASAVTDEKLVQMLEIHTDSSDTDDPCSVFAPRYAAGYCPRWKGGSRRLNSDAHARLPRHSKPLIFSNMHTARRAFNTCHTRNFSRVHGAQVLQPSSGQDRWIVVASRKNNSIPSMFHRT